MESPKRLSCNIETYASYTEARIMETSETKIKGVPVTINRQVISSYHGSLVGALEWAETHIKAVGAENEAAA